MLYDYHNVGKLVYNKMRSSLEKMLSITQATVMKLLASDLITLFIDDKDIPKAYFKLILEDGMIPSYLIEHKCEYITQLK